ncbi:MAG TPA: hypothetical protein VMB72_07965 [Acidimicrobiales bacterium]|nr:hypothetical protein [Acidimicrobiales bacterium]
MLAVALRQCRLRLAVAGAGLAALAVVVAVAGPQVAHAYDDTVANCAASHDCALAAAALRTRYGLLSGWLDVVVAAVPVLLGMFWGAPLVARELETGTYRLAWTQGVTRSRWLLAKLGVLTLGAVAAAGVASLLVTWWAGPLDRVAGTPFASFATRGVVPSGYAAFAFVLGVAAGVVLRRTLPAMAVALVGTVAARVVVTVWVRPHLFPARVLATSAVSVGPLSPGLPLPAGSWVLSQSLLDRAGHVVASQGGLGGGGLTIDIGPGVRLGSAGSCPNLRVTPGSIPGPQAIGALVQRCAAQLHLHELVTYQPAGRYWPLQWAELGLFLAAAVVVGAAAWWWVRRRLV